MPTMITEWKRTAAQGISFRYDGSFVQGHWSGLGILLSANGDSYEGEFATSRNFGNGSLDHAQTDKMSGTQRPGKY